MTTNSRDNARTPVQWDDGPQAGFTTATPWIDVTPNYPQVNAAAQVGVPGSVFEHYRALIALRHADDAVALGAFRLLDAGQAASWCVLREHVASGGSDGEVGAASREQVLLLASLTREGLALGEGSALRELLAERGVDLAEWADAERLLLASLPAEAAPASGAGAPERLAGWDSIILRRVSRITSQNPSRPTQTRQNPQDYNDPRKCGVL